MNRDQEQGRVGLKDRLERDKRARLLKEQLEAERRFKKKKAQLKIQHVETDIESGSNWIFVVCILSLVNVVLLLATRFDVPGADFIWHAVMSFNDLVEDALFGIVSALTVFLPSVAPGGGATAADGIFAVGLGFNVLSSDLGASVAPPWDALFTLADFGIIFLLMAIAFRSRHGEKWAFSAAMLLYLADAAILTYYQAWDMAIFHVVVFYKMNTGLMACYHEKPAILESED